MPSTFRPFALLALLALVPAAGCDEKQKVSRDGVIADYQAARYQRAYDGAEVVYGSADGVGRDEMAYIAGVSAYRLGKHDRALVRLIPVTRSADAAIAGRSAATVGLIYRDRDRHAEAQRYLRQAAQKLDGEDKARAYYELGVVQQRLGRFVQARASFDAAREATGDMALRRKLLQERNVSGFALQFGAYSKQPLAQKRSQAVQSKVRAARMSGPRIVSATIDGRTLYLVQAGRFGTYAEALKAKSWLNVGDCLVVPTKG